MTETRLKLKEGEINITANGKDTVYLDTGAWNTEKFVGLTLRGIRYYVSAHLARENGEWKLDTFESGTTRLYMSREGWGKEPSLAARKKAREVLIAAVTEWANANTQAFNEAEVKRLEREIESRQDKRGELLKEAHTLDEEINNLQQELRTAEWGRG